MDESCWEGKGTYGVYWERKWVLNSYPLVPADQLIGIVIVHRGVDISPSAGWPQEDVMKYWHERANYEKAGGIQMYGISKLLLEYGVREIAKLAVGTSGQYVIAQPCVDVSLILIRYSTEVIVTSMCPGPVKTELAREVMGNPIVAFVAKSMLTIFMKSTKQGALALVHAAFKKPEENGTFFMFYQSEKDYKM